MTGAWTYAVDNTLGAVQGLNDGVIDTDTFTVRSVDNTTKTVTITITGTEDVPVVARKNQGKNKE